MRIERGQPEHRQAPQLLGLLGELEQLPESIAAAVRGTDWTMPQLEAAVARSTWKNCCSKIGGLLNSKSGITAAELCGSRPPMIGGLRQTPPRSSTRSGERFLDHVRTSNLAASQLSPDEREFKRRYGQGRRGLEHEFGKSMRFQPQFANWSMPIRRS